MGTFEPELNAALNTLLEGERASAEMEVALASGATEYTEREALTAMGGEDIEACCELRRQLDLLEIPTTWRVHGAVYSVLNEVRYDDRLRAFAAHQRAVGEHAESLLRAELPPVLREILIGIRDSHVRHVLWCERRAEEFAATRQIDFGTPGGRMTFRQPGSATAPVGIPPEGADPADATLPVLPEEIEAPEPARYPRDAARAPRAIPRYPYVPGVGATQVTEDDGDQAVGEPLPDTTLE